MEEQKKHADSPLSRVQEEGPRDAKHMPIYRGGDTQQAYVPPTAIIDQEQRQTTITSMKQLLNSQFHERKMKKAVEAPLENNID